WTRCYAPKPMISVQMQALLAPQIQAKFGENHSYCDVHTAVTPFQRVDYDARVPGAGTFRRTFECFGRLLYNEKFAHKGPVYSEGRNHWWYAGLTDGNYAQLVSPDPPREPLFVDFDLLKMHPLQMDAGMGSPGMFYRGSKLRNYRQFIATTLAYGHIGFLEAGEADMMRMYYLLQPLQQHYVMKKVKRIYYGDGKTTSQALASGAMAEGRVCVQYEGGTVVYVNGSDKPWNAIPAPGFDRQLPPWGFVGYANGGRVRSMHALLNAVPVRRGKSVPRRSADLSHGPDSHYLASADGFLRTAELATDGAGVLKREGDGWELIPAREFGAFGFAPRLVDCTDRPFAVRAVAEDGTLGDQVPVRWSRGLCYLLRGKDAPFKYRIVPGEGSKGPDESVVSPSLAVAGQHVRVRVATDFLAQWHSANGTRQEEAVRDEAGICTVGVPTDLPVDQLVWLELRDGNRTCWLDYLSMAPLALRVETTPRDYGPGAPGHVRVVLDNRLKRAQAVLLSFAPDKGKIEQHKQEVTVPGMGSATVDVPWQLPWKTGKAKLDVTAEAGDVTVRASLQIQAEITPRVFRDLLGADVAWGKGSCSRGGKEVTGLSDYYDGSVSVNDASCGGVKRKALFMHPPYGRRVAGYVFAEIPVKLPKEPVRLRTFTGLRDGMDASDGVVFSVQVTPEGEPAQTVFERHHKALKWEPAEVDLSTFAGRRVTLRLTVDCGPADNTSADHAQWGELGLVFQQEVLRVR
ncbi:MAG: hypothetical protein HN380_25520, partial [Victivallales bacterium]|nr:hypothetical protein [Victivallales bacterium]